jgi:hypothetical protein
MNHIIEDLSDGRGARNQYTYDETLMLTAYKRAQMEIRETLQDKSAAAARGYDSDLKFRQELLQRYFSPALQAQWARANGRALAAAPSAAAPSAAPPSAAAPSAPSRPAPAPPVKPAIGPLDPGIAKARAANVATKVFGFPFGEPLSLPECDFALSNRPCYAERDIDKTTAAITGVKPVPMYTVGLPQSSCPSWAQSICVFTATMQDGRMVAAVIRTKGRDVEKAVGTELRGKYGNRVSMQQRIISPNNGSREFTVSDLDWELPGLHVVYRVLDNSTIDGYVMIESETLYNARKAREAQAAKPKL